MKTKMRAMSVVCLLFLAGLAGGVRADMRECHDTTKKTRSTCSAGGAGGIVPAIHWIDLAPVKIIVENEPDLGLYSFDFSDNKFFMFGGQGYGGTRNGVKIGGGGWFGMRDYVSDSRRCLLSDSVSLALNRGDTLEVDSVAHLYTMVAYGGLIVGKNFAVDNFCFEVGGLLGGGAIILGKDLRQSNGSAFSNSPPMMEDTLSGQWTVAPLFTFDVHTGVTYRIAPFIVVGADASLLFFQSSTGFNMNTDSFLTMNPGIRLKVLFGNL